MDLVSIQSFLADVLRRPSSLVADADVTKVAASIATGNERLSPVQQIDIYREQFFLRHVDCLRDDFRSIERWLGDDAFDALARAYLASHPPASFTLRDLGVHMAEFVAARSPWSADRLLVDLARIEWAFVDAFDGPDALPFDPASIAGAAEDDWPNARIALDPAMQRVALAHAAHEYRDAVRAKPADEAIDAPAARSCFVVVYRGPERLHYVEIEEEAFMLLAELAEGARLAEACERAATASAAELATFEDKLGTWFQEWTARGWIRRVDF